MKFNTYVVEGLAPVQPVGESNPAPFRVDVLKPTYHVD